MHVKSIISDVRKKARIGSKLCSISSSDDDFFMSQMESGCSFLLSFSFFFWVELVIAIQ